MERELNILIFQLNQDKPNVKKRKGKFKKSRLKLKDGNRISLPSGLFLFPAPYLEQLYLRQIVHFQCWIQLLTILEIAILKSVASSQVDVQKGIFLDENSSEQMLHEAVWTVHF